MNFDTLLLNVTNAIQFNIISFVASFENLYKAATELSTESLPYIRRLFSFVSENWCPIHFTDLQTTLLAVFVAIIVINLSLIGFFWNKYGGVITDRFIRPSKLRRVAGQQPQISTAKQKLLIYVLIFTGTQKEIEELKLSVAKLKLPCEHTPRI